MISSMVQDHGSKWSVIAGAICEASKARAAQGLGTARTGEGSLAVPCLWLSGSLTLSLSLSLSL